MKMNGTITAFALLLAFALASHGAVILAYDMGTSASPTLDPTFEAAQVIGGTIANGGDIEPAKAGLSTLAARDRGWVSDPVLQANPSAGVTLYEGKRSTTKTFTNGDYFGITLTPVAGYTLNLSKLSFNAEGGGTSNPPRSISVFTSLTGDTKLLWENVGDPADYTKPTMKSFSVDLAGFAQLQGLTAPVLFKFGVGSNDATKSIEFDDITFEGSAIPEPASLGLLGLGAVALLLRRYRHA